MDMPRIYGQEQWYGLVHEARQDPLYDHPALRDFVAIDPSRESLPDAAKLLKFR